MKRDFSMSPEVQATVEPSLEAFRLGKAFLSGVVKVQVLPCRWPCIRAS